MIKEVLGFRRFHLRGLRGAEGEWKLCLSGGEDLEPELYDLLQDPGEFTNLAGDPAAAGVQEHMTTVLLRRWDWRRIDREVRASQQRRQLIRAAVGKHALS